MRILIRYRDIPLDRPYTIECKGGNRPSASNPTRKPNDPLEGAEASTDGSLLAIRPHDHP